MKLVNAEEVRQIFDYEVAQGATDLFDAFDSAIENATAVDADPVVRGWWKEYSHSALVNWKNGEPVWADRTVYRCSGCDFGTIIKHNYCPRCGANMMDYERSPHE